MLACVSSLWVIIKRSFVGMGYFAHVIESASEISFELRWQSYHLTHIVYNTHVDTCIIIHVRYIIYSPVCV